MARLVISDDALNLRPDQRLAVGVRIVDEDPGELLAVRTSFGWVVTMSIEVIIRRRLVERLGTLDPDEQAAVDVALRTVTGI